MIVGQLPTTAAARGADGVPAHQVGSGGQSGQRGEHRCGGPASTIVATDSNTASVAARPKQHPDTHRDHGRGRRRPLPVRVIRRRPTRPSATRIPLLGRGPGFRERGHRYPRTRARTRCRRSGTRSIDCSKLRSACQDTMSTPMVAMSRYIAERCSAQSRSTRGSFSPSNGRAIENVDGDHDMAAFAEVDQRQREFGVEQRGERDDDRARRNGRTRRQCARCVFESVAGAEHRVEHPIELALTDVSAEPPRAVVAERDDPGAITVAQCGLHHLSRAAHHTFGGLGRRAGRLPVRVDQHHHVGRAVGQSLRHVQLPAACAHRPVHRSQLVTGHERANVGVLDTRAEYGGSGGHPGDRATRSAGSAWTAAASTETQ